MVLPLEHIAENAEYSDLHISFSKPLYAFAAILGNSSDAFFVDTENVLTNLNT